MMKTQIDEIAHVLTTECLCSVLLGFLLELFHLHHMLAQRGIGLDKLTLCLTHTLQPSQLFSQCAIL